MGTDVNVDVDVDFVVVVLVVVNVIVDVDVIESAIAAAFDDTNAGADVDVDDATVPPNPIQIMEPYPPFDANVDVVSGTKVCDPAARAVAPGAREYAVPPIVTEGAPGMIVTPERTIGFPD